MSKELLLVANWKSNKTTAEAITFLRQLQGENLEASQAQAVICPPYLAVPEVSKFARSNNLAIGIGVQDVSAFEDGAYTGEVSAKQASEFAEYAIIGHSERRSNFGETDEDVAKKAALAKQHGLTPIVCIRNAQEPVPQEASYIAYEPPESIGSGKPAPRDNVQEVFSILSEKYPGKPLLYGGSLNANIIKDYLSIQGIGGFLVGGASLEASSFIALLKQC